MPDVGVSWPVKRREMHSHHFDSTVWNDFGFRDDDIVIATYGKAGTTWLQQIVGQLIFGGREDIGMADLSPWLDLRVPPKEVKLAQLREQKHRRFIKTHLPVDALLFSPRAKYLYVARDGRDVVWSLYNHHANATEEWYRALNDTPGRVGPPIDKPDPDIRRYFLTWLERDGHPFWPFWENLRSWWAIRDLPNLMLLHFNALKADLDGEMHRIAEFLEIPVAGQGWQRLVELCTFDYMKQHADRTAPRGGAMWRGGGATFINRGSNGRWRDLLTVQDVRAYEARAVQELGEACAHWLATGERPV